VKCLEAARVMENLPGIPHVRLGTAEPYFNRLQERLEGHSSLPLWDGELYLEYHRGTYTSQANNKRNNRASEILFHNTEWLNSLACTLLPNRSYPSRQINLGWELILLYQFHDILTGSSIRDVYAQSEEDYAMVKKIGEETLYAARQDIISQIQTQSDSLVIFNSLSRPRSPLLNLPWDETMSGKTIAGDEGPCLSQRIVQDGKRRLLIAVSPVPSLGYRAFPIVEDPEQPPTCWKITTQHIENEHFKIALNPQGQIISLIDKENDREVIVQGQRANVLQVFEDKPLNFDAWDIDIYYQEKMCEITDLVEAVVEETGPLRGVLRLVWRFLDSRITQWITVYRASRRIDFRTEVDWHEHQVLLKAAFPVNIRATRASYEIQFGSIERPTTWNTSWDYARFEVPAHRWADLSEGDYGVALLNDCKYGYDVKDNVLRLTLIKSGIYPDPNADQGHHSFTYSLLPHPGDWRSGRVSEEAHDLNYPLIPGFAPANSHGCLPEQVAFASVTPENLIVETIKKAEDDEALVVRVYESRQCRTKEAHILFALPIRKACECSMLEEEESPMEWTDKAIHFQVDPFEIKTFKIWF
jgi:alpha-mannosidase